MPSRTKCSESIDPSETGAVRSVMPCRGTGRPSETGVVRSVAQLVAGENRSHDLCSSSASRFDMDEPCFSNQYTDSRVAVGDLDAPRSGGSPIQLDAFGRANARTRSCSPIASPLIRDRVRGTVGTVFCSGGLQINVDYREVSNCCRVAPLSPIAEEVVTTPTYDTTPVEPVATPASHLPSLQSRTHILSIGGDGTAPPLSVVTENAIWLPAWPESHHEDVDSSEPSVIEVSEFVARI